MNLTAAIQELEAALTEQTALSSGDPAVQEAAGRLVAFLSPAVRQLGMSLVQQAAEEIGAQLRDREIEILLSDGEPSLRVRSVDPDPDVLGGDYEARLTLRLPDALKGLVEDEAGTEGDSVNSWIVKVLSSRAGSRRSGERMRRTINL